MIYITAMKVSTFSFKLVLSPSSIELLLMPQKNSGCNFLSFMAVNFHPMCESQQVHWHIVHAYPGNQLNSVDGDPTSVSDSALYTVNVSKTYPFGLTYVPCGPRIDIENMSSFLAIFVLHRTQHKYKYSCRMDSNQRSRWIGQSSVKNCSR